MSQSVPSKGIGQGYPAVQRCSYFTSRKRCLIPSAFRNELMEKAWCGVVLNYHTFPKPCVKSRCILVIEESGDGYERVGLVRCINGVDMVFPLLRRKFRLK